MDTLWGNCPIAGKCQPRVLTNGQSLRLFSRKPQKGMMPVIAGFPAPNSKMSTERIPVRPKTPWG